MSTLPAPRSIWQRFISDVVCELVVTVVQLPVLLPIHLLAAAYLMLSVEVASVERCVAALLVTMVASSILVVAVRNLAVPRGHLFGTPSAMTISTVVGPVLAGVVGFGAAMPWAFVGTATLVGALAGAAHAAGLLVWLRPWRGDDHPSERHHGVVLPFPAGVVHTEQVRQAA